jgi:flagellar protein FlbD
MHSTLGTACHSDSEPLVILTLSLPRGRIPASALVCFTLLLLLTKVWPFPCIAESESDAHADRVAMIELTRLNGHRLLLNCDLLKYVEASPDTLLTLVTGDKVVVLETCEQVKRLAVDHQAQVLRMAWPSASRAPGVLSTRAAWDGTKRCDAVMLDTGGGDTGSDSE